MYRKKWIVIAGLPFVAYLLLLILVVRGTSDIPAYRYSQSNLVQFAKSFYLHNLDESKCPPSAVTDEDGTPLLSWRVIILPYIEQDALYREFRFDEPWDGPHNGPLLKRLPKPLRVPNETGDPLHSTHYQLVAGPGTAFENGEMNLDDFQDGVGNTIMMVEAGKPVPWSKPEDWNYHPEKPLPPLGCGFSAPWKILRIPVGRKQGFNALFGDGSVRFLWQDTDGKVLRALFTRNGGETINIDDLP